MRALALLLAALGVIACSKHREDVRPDDREVPRRRVTCKLPEGDIIITRVVVPAGCHLAIDHDVHVHTGGELLIEPGARLLFAQGTSLRVSDGLLLAKGTPNEPIVFTSNKDHPAAGDWGGIVLESRTMGIPPLPTPMSTDAAPRISAMNAPELDHVIVEYAGRAELGVHGALTILPHGSRLSLSHAVLRKNARAGVVVFGKDARFVRFEANVFLDNGGLAIDIPADLMGSIGEGRFDEPIRISGNIYGSQSWPKVSKVLVGSHLSVGARAGEKAIAVTIAEGTTVAMQKGSVVVVGSMPLTSGDASLVARKVRFTSAEPKPSPGDWHGIVFGERAGGSVLEECTIEYAARLGTDRVALEMLDDTKIRIERTTFDHGMAAAIAAPDCKVWDAPTRGNTSIGQPMCVPNGLGLSGVGGVGK